MRNKTKNLYIIQLIDMECEISSQIKHRKVRIQRLNKKFTELKQLISTI